MAEVGAPPSAKVFKVKICLVGEPSVGKTSLIRRFVHGTFDESYIRTLGAVVSKKVVDLGTVGGRPTRMDLAVYDLMGQRRFLDLFREAYFRGAGGVLAVADLTHRPTLVALDGWVKAVESVGGRLPIAIVGNKADLSERAEVGPAELEAAAKRLGADYAVTSAKTGAGVEEAFRCLSRLAWNARSKD